MNVRTRFAPSPTGYLHIGSVRTALYAWLYARHHGGQTVLRIEDTDRQRSTQAAVDAILNGLDWLGLQHDEGPVFQTSRFDRYREVIEQLAAQGAAYPCYCTKQDIELMRERAQARGEKPRYDGRCRDGASVRPDVAPVIRFRNPLDGQVVIDDQVKGRIVFDNTELDDLIIARSDGTPTYNFTVVVDDADMRITHVIRGDDHLNNTPRQANIFMALGLEPPVYAHLPMIHGPDGAKLSKRHGAVNVLEYRQMGFLPAAMLNYLARLGWSHGDQEIFTLAELIRFFDLDRVSRSAASFDPAKLLWVNQQHIKSSPAETLAPMLGERLPRHGARVEEGPPLEMAVDALRERSQTLEEMAERAHCYYAELQSYDEKAAKAHLVASNRPVLAALHTALGEVEVWSVEATEAAVQEVAQSLELKLGKVAQPLRVALTGQTASPGIGTTLVLVGKKRALRRIENALAYIGGALPGEAGRAEPGA